MDILTGENLSSIYVANMDLIYFLARSSSRRGGDGLSLIGDIVILASCKYHLINIHENLVQHPSNNISILLPLLKKRMSMQYPKTCESIENL